MKAWFDRKNEPFPAFNEYFSDTPDTRHLFKIALIQNYFGIGHYRQPNQSKSKVFKTLTTLITTIKNFRKVTLSKQKIMHFQSKMQFDVWCHSSWLKRTILEPSYSNYLRFFFRPDSLSFCIKPKKAISIRHSGLMPSITQNNSTSPGSKHIQRSLKIKLCTTYAYLVGMVA